MVHNHRTLTRIQPADRLKGWKGLSVCSVFLDLLLEPFNFKDLPSTCRLQLEDWQHTDVMFILLYALLVLLGHQGQEPTPNVLIGSEEWATHQWDLQFTLLAYLYR